MMTLLHRWLILGLLGLVILPCLLVADSKAETVAVSIRGDSVMIKMDLVLEENITALPLVNVQIGPSNSTLQYYIDGSNTRTSTIPELTTQNFSLLDFAWVLPLSSMTSSQSIIGGYTNWAFDPSSPVYNLTIGVPSPEGGLFQKWTAFYNPSINVTVPAAAWATGNVVYFDTPSSTETVMPMIIGASLFTAVGT